MAIYYGPTEKSNILSRLNGIYMGSPTKEVNWNDFGMAADVTSYVKDKFIWSEELTRQYLGYNG